MLNIVNRHMNTKLTRYNLNTLLNKLCNYKQFWISLPIWNSHSVVQSPQIFMIFLPFPLLFQLIVMNKLPSIPPCPGLIVMAAPHLHIQPHVFPHVWDTSMLEQPGSSWTQTKSACLSFNCQLSSPALSWSLCLSITDITACAITQPETQEQCLFALWQEIIPLPSESWTENKTE